MELLPVNIRWKILRCFMGKLNIYSIRNIFAQDSVIYPCFQILVFSNLHLLLSRAKLDLTLLNAYVLSSCINIDFTLKAAYFIHFLCPPCIFNVYLQNQVSSPQWTEFTFQMIQHRKEFLESSLNSDWKVGKWWKCFWNTEHIFLLLQHYMFQLSGGAVGEPLKIELYLFCGFWFG